MTTTIRCDIVSAEAEIFQGEATLVVATGEMGELGIAMTTVAPLRLPQLPWRELDAAGVRFGFGTDGIRGRANAGTLDAATAMKVGQAAGRHFLRGDHKHRIIIGKDTRLSGYMIETALVAGFTSVGMDVLLFGPMPTPVAAPPAVVDDDVTYG